MSKLFASLAPALNMKGGEPSRRGSSGGIAPADRNAAFCHRDAANRLDAAGVAAAATPLVLTTVAPIVYEVVGLEVLRRARASESPRIVRYGFEDRSKIAPRVLIFIPTTARYGAIATDGAETRCRSAD